MTEIVINILSFSSDPWGRDSSENPDSNGEQFRKQFLVHAFQNYNKVIIDFSGLDFLPDSSFLGEAFVGLVKKEGFTYEEILHKLDIRPSESIYPYTIRRMLQIAQENDMKATNKE